MHRPCNCPRLLSCARTRLLCDERLRSGRTREGAASAAGGAVANWSLRRRSVRERGGGGGEEESRLSLAASDVTELLLRSRPPLFLL